MAILKKGSLTISGKDCKIDGYSFDVSGEGMRAALISILEEGVKDLQAQIERAKSEDLEVTDGGENFKNGEEWKFGEAKFAPFAPFAPLAPESPPASVRWVDNIGMDLRDYFAGQAMQGICANQDTWGLTADGIVKKSFEIADAMIARRSKP